MGIMQTLKESIMGRPKPQYSEAPQEYSKPIEARNVDEYTRKSKMRDMERVYFERERMKAQKKFFKDRAKRKVEEFYSSKPSAIQRVVSSAQARKRPTYNQAQVVGKQFGVRVPKQGYQGKKGYAGRGRPRGPSGRYIIPGKGAVGVYEYRKFRAQQRLAQRMQADKISKQSYGPMPQQYPNDPQMQQQIQQQVQQQMQQQPQYQQPQYVEQQPQGLSLTGGFELLNVNMNKNLNAPKKSVWDVETPQDYGDYYTEPDFISGKQVLRRRVRSMPKW
jgi:hypothetical protein